MFSKRSIERLAGALLLAGFVAFLGHGVTLFTLGAGPTTILFVLLYCPGSRQRPTLLQQPPELSP